MIMEASKIRNDTYTQENIAPFGLDQWGPESVVWMPGPVKIRFKKLLDPDIQMFFDSEASAWKAAANNLIVKGYMAPCSLTIDEAMTLCKSFGLRGFDVVDGDLREVARFYVR